MIEHVKGILDFVGQGFVVIEAGGIGYRIEVPLSILSDLPKEGAPLHLFTSQIIRESETSLFGFLSREERALFERLITVSGIGPKMALALFSKHSAERICQAIVDGKSEIISEAPGIGKKTAERLILELKDKLPALGRAPASSVGSDACQALMHLGYPEARARKAVDAALEIDPTAPLSHLIRQALQCV